MADNVLLNSGTGGATAAADDIAGVHYQRVKLSVGADGTANDAVPVSNGMDVTGAAVQAVGIVAQLDDVATGAVTENQFAPVRLSSRRALLVEGVASGTAVVVDGSGVTQPVSHAALTELAAAIDTELQVDVVAALPAGTNNIGDVDVLSVVPGVGATNLGKAEDAAHTTGDVGVMALTVRQDSAAALAGTDADYQPLITDASGRLHVNVGNTVTVQATNLDVQSGGADLATSTQAAAIQTAVEILDNAISGNEMQVDVITMPNVTLAAGTNTNEVVGDIAHDTGVSGNPVQIAGAAQDMDDTAPPNRVSAESDVTRLATDRDGGLFVHPHGPQIWSYHLDTSSAQTDTTVHASPGAGLSLYVTDIVFSSGAATAINLFFEEGSTKVLGPYYLEAVAGRGMHIKFQTPKKITAATALTLTTSAAIAHSVDVTGFVAAG